MIKFEIREEHIEETFCGEMPPLSAQDVYDIWDRKSSHDDNLVAEFDTIEEARCDFEKVYRKWARTSVERGSRPKYISANLVFLWRMELDDDTQDVEQGDIIDYAAAPYEGEKSEQIRKAKRTGIMNADMIEMMVNDWLADNADEMEDLTLIGKPYYSADLDRWCQDAEDKDCAYTLTAEADGNIHINYSGED